MEIKNITYTTGLDEVVNQLQEGAFLTTSTENELNTMTIAWGTIGYIWNRPVFQVLVRKSRHTHKLIEEADEFTVSIPYPNKMSKELAYCGRVSGRDANKFSELNLETISPQKLSTPMIKGCAYHYECNIIHTEKMELDNLVTHLQDDFYPEEDYHYMYYGEITAAYKD